MAWGPVLKNCRITLVLESDDGFHPFQSSLLIVLAPRRGLAYVPNRFAFWSLPLLRIPIQSGHQS